MSVILINVKPKGAILLQVHRPGARLPPKGIAPVDG